MKKLMAVLTISAVLMTGCCVPCFLVPAVVCSGGICTLKKLSDNSKSSVSNPADTSMASTEKEENRAIAER